MCASLVTLSRAVLEVFEPSIVCLLSALKILETTGGQYKKQKLLKIRILPVI